MARDAGSYPELMKLSTLALALSQLGAILKHIRGRTYCPGAAIGALMPIAALFEMLYRRYEFAIREMPPRDSSYGGRRGAPCNGKHKNEGVE